MSKYGYLDDGNNVESGLRHVQNMAHIPETGIIDDETLNFMRKPRCGVPDHYPGFAFGAKRFLATPFCWSKQVSLIIFPSIFVTCLIV